MRVAIALLLFTGTARADDDVVWRTYAALRNDVFSELRAPYDDAGFTHDNVFSLRRTARDVTFGGSFLHRWVTSREDLRRWDQLELLAIAGRTWGVLVVEGRAGPVFGGNFGGRKMQNGWHELSGTGPTLDEGLQFDYPEGRRVGVLAGGRARATKSRSGTLTFDGTATLDGQLAANTGVSSIELAAGGRARTRHLGVHGELALTRYRVSDPLLALPGGYGTGFQLEWRVGIHFQWSRFVVGYQYRANEGGSGEPIGVFSFESRR